MLTKKIAVLFSGSGSNLEAILKKVHNQIFNGIKIEVCLCICNKPGAFGIERAKKFGLDTQELPIYDTPVVAWHQTLHSSLNMGTGFWHHNRSGA